MRIIFMGTPGFAVPCLSLLHSSDIEVVSVITSPDKPSGRGRKLHGSAIKEFAIENEIPVLQPSNLKDPAFLKELEDLKADLFVVVAFRMLPAVVWKMPLKGTINLHASLLPNYRGAAPINWAIINGEIKTGLSTFFINEDIDTGSIIDQREIAILPEDDMGSLHDKMSSLGAQLLLETVEDLSKEPITGKEQLKKDNHLEAPKLNSENIKIDFREDSEKVHNLIRGLSPYPGAYTFLKKEDEALKVKIFKSSFGLEKISEEVGFSVNNGKDDLFISCGKGHLKVLELQIQGKKRMKTRDLLNGFKLKNGAKFG